ncbi:glycosyltransferase [Egbenema bharatensis]|uniref:glycosyltransferase n=1 Tax=Egbenema bharatensis TaxID=3463334 RepID=UPI003A8942ED
MFMQPYLSVIICSHNPRVHYYERVLKALEFQTLTDERWELLLVDNASDKVLASEIDLNWHPYARHIREEQLGLTHARLRGIKEAQSDILVFVDDDNVLDPDYLEIVFKIAKNWPIIGAWGGQLRPKFEIPPPAWTEEYLDMLAIREFGRNKWSNLTSILQNGAIPVGAGLCVRKVVAEKYADLILKDPKRSTLDRKGQRLTSCGDLDLALTACDLGLGTGQFTELGLTHLIPAFRLQEDYLLKLVKSTAYSFTVLRALRGEAPTLPCYSARLYQKYAYWRMNSRQRRFEKARQDGFTLAYQEISTW